MQAENEYQRLDRADVPIAEKIVMLRAWLERHADPELVSGEFRRMEQVARRYPTPAPVKRLRLTEF